MDRNKLLWPTFLPLLVALSALVAWAALDVDAILPFLLTTPVLALVLAHLIFFDEDWAQMRRASANRHPWLRGVLGAELSLGKRLLLACASGAVVILMLALLGRGS